MKVIDRFLSEKEFERLKSEMMAYNFQWHMSKIVDDNDCLLYTSDAADE